MLNREYSVTIKNDKTYYVNATNPQEAIELVLKDKKIKHIYSLQDNFRTQQYLQNKANVIVKLVNSKREVINY